MELNTKLRMLRKDRGLTLAEVSAKTELSVSFLSDVERGRTKPSLDTLEKLSESYQISVTDLLAEVDFGKPTSDIRYPPGYAEFVAELGEVPEKDKEVLALVLKVEQRAKFRAQTKEDWKKYYYSLKTILE